MEGLNRGRDTSFFCNAAPEERRNQVVQGTEARESVPDWERGLCCPRCSICFFFEFCMLRPSVARERSSRSILGSVLSVSQLASASERMANAA